MSACAPSHSKNGILIASDPGSDRLTTSDTCSCTHCGLTWIHVPGSGKLRGFCMRCGGQTCGPKCPAGQGCVPAEVFLENLERNRPLDHRPIVAAVPRSTGGVLLGK